MILSLKSKFNALASRALFISSSKLVVYHWYKNNIGESYIFDANADGFEFFRRYLDTIKKVSVYILLDLTTEEYRVDTIPHVFGSDRKAVIERKRDRIFRNAPYFYTEIQGREKSGRKDDKILLSAITTPQMIQPWLEILETNKIPLASMVSVPLLIQEIKAIIPDMKGNSLVFSLQSISGLRQSFFSDRSLKFSRLVKIPRYGTEPYAPIITDELLKVRRYIQNIKFVDDNQPLNIYLFGDQKLLGELRETHTDSLMIHYHFLNIAVLGEACGLAEQQRTPFSDKYFVYQLLKYKSKNYYARWKETRYFQMQRVGNALRVASFFLVFISVIWTSINILQGFIYRQQQKSEVKRVDFYQNRYEVAKARVPALSIKPNDLKIVIDAEDTLKKYKADPVIMFKLISERLDNFPEISISQIKWAANIDPHYQLANTKSDSTATKDHQGTSGFNNASDAETGYLYYQIALLDGYLNDFSGDYRMALAMIEQFSKSLKDHATDTSIVSLPLNIKSDTNMEGSAKNNVAPSNFSIRIVLAVKNEA